MALSLRATKRKHVYNREDKGIGKIGRAFGINGFASDDYIKDSRVTTSREGGY